MSGAVPFGRGPQKTDTGRPPFFQLGNEILDVFQPIMGAHCFTIYSHLVRRVFKNPELKHSIRVLAVATELGASTVFRALEIMAHLGLVKLKRRGGSQESECVLCDSSEAATRLGAQYTKSLLSWSFPPEVKVRLEAEIREIRQRQQGKRSLPVPSDRGNQSSVVSQRDASVSVAIRQRSTRETQMGSHLIREEGTIEEGPSPTPSRLHESDGTKACPNEDGTDADLIWGQVKFTGVMKDMGSHLLDSSRPPVPHLANGATEWEEYGLNSLAVEAAGWRGEVLVLTLSARNPATARRGLDRYHQFWERALRKWFECEVIVNLVRTT